MIAVIADVEIRNNLFNIFDFVNTLADNLTTVRLEIYCVIFFSTYYTPVYNPFRIDENYNARTIL